jgi:hypothetical protein
MGPSPVAFDFARVGRTLQSDAFDFDLKGHGSSRADITLNVLIAGFSRPELLADRSFDFRCEPPSA